MKSLYDVIGKTYDTTRKADPEISRRIWHALQCERGAKVLDVACGSGNYTTALQEIGATMCGLDISADMLAKAKEKAPYMNWVHASATEMPFASDAFQAAMSVLSIHHFADMEKAFRETYRVLQRGRFVIFTSCPQQMKDYWLNHYFPAALEASIQQMPKTTQVIASLQAAKFRIIGVESFLIQPDLQDFFLYSGKYRPALYLEESVRQGISTFVNLASETEVAAGCERLREDIETGEIENVLQRYYSKTGDYQLIVAEK